MTTTEKILNTINDFSRKQISLRKDSETKLSIPAPIALLAVLLMTKPTVLACVAAALLGYTFSMSEKAEECKVVREVPADAKPAMEVAD